MAGARLHAGQGDQGKQPGAPRRVGRVENSLGQYHRVPPLSAVQRSQHPGAHQHALPVLELVFVEVPSSFLLVAINVFVASSKHRKEREVERGACVAVFRPGVCRSRLTGSVAEMFEPLTGTAVAVQQARRLELFGQSKRPLGPARGVARLVGHKQAPRTSFVGDRELMRGWKVLEKSGCRLECGC